ncbi:MAG: S8 family serine peptidase [Elusimicrobia bacterium]|nr:S8 family serine peptidase [Elusimicrobiota bacterium]
MKKVLGGLLLAGLLSAPACAIPIEKMFSVADGRPVEVVAGQALVRFSSHSYQSKDHGEVAGTGWRLVVLSSGMKVAEGLAWLKTLPGVLDVEPNHVLRTTRMPSDPLASSQYALQRVNAFGAWEYDTGGTSRVTVAVIDTGIDGSHPDLSGKLTSTSQFYDPDNSDGDQTGVNQPPTPACNHATRVAGVAAAYTDNGLGIAGMSWGGGLISLKVFEDNDCGLTESGCEGATCATSVPVVVNAINYARGLHNTAGIGKVVINMSIGDSVNCPGPLQAAITNAVNAGVLVVASAGNDGNAVMSPANCSGVVPVGATDQSDAVASFSSRGVALAANGLVAPGVGVLTTTLNNDYAGATGTSFSAPMVAGAAALVWSARPDFTASQVKDTLRNSADNIGVSALGAGSGAQTGGRAMGETSGAGRLNAFRALRLAVRGTLSDFEGDQKAIAFPNPFRFSQDSQVTLTIPTAVQGGRSVIKVYNAAGVFVRELSGTTWDGKNAAGQRVVSGVYTFVVTTDKGTALGRLTVVR